MKMKNKALSIVIIVILAGAGFFVAKKFLEPSQQAIQISSPPNKTRTDSNSEISNPTDVPQKTATDTNKSESQAPAPDKTPAKADDSQPKNSAGINITDRLVSWGFTGFSARSIDTIIIHSTYDAIGADPFSVPGVIAEYKSYGVSPHYLIDRGGNIYRLVQDKNIAYHAGVSQVPDGRTNVNDFSIGIELINTKTDKFTGVQYSALNNLISQLKNQYKIKYVLGHNQIAPGRKDDPWNFDWSKIK